jgi:hypothetical protein
MDKGENVRIFDIGGKQTMRIATPKRRKTVHADTSTNCFRCMGKHKQRNCPLQRCHTCNGFGHCASNCGLQTWNDIPMIIVQLLQEPA